MKDLQRIVGSPLESSCYLLQEQGRCLIVDPNEAGRILPVLAGQGLEPELCLLTHEHCDHMAGLETLRQQYPQMRTVATAACSSGLADTRLNMSHMMEIYLTFSGQPGISYQPFVCQAAEITFEETLELDWRGHYLQLTHLPGHTRGSCGILLDGEVFFSGDYLLPDKAPILRLPGGSEEDYARRALPFLEALPAGLWICPGHGEPYRLPERRERWL